MDITCNQCGLMNDFHVVTSGPHQTAYCNGCDKFIKHLPQEKPAILYFGKHKGRLVSTMQSTDEKEYLKWVKDNCSVSKKIHEAIIQCLA